MTPDAVINPELPGELAVSFLRVVEGHRVCPFPTQSLDTVLSLVVGAWLVGPGSNVLQTKRAAGLGTPA